MLDGNLSNFSALESKQIFAAATQVRGDLTEPTCWRNQHVTVRQDQLIENGDPKPWTREFRTRLSFHVDDGATGVRHVTAEPVSGHVSHPVVVRGQEDETSVLHVPVQETPQLRQVRQVSLDNEIVCNAVLAFSSTDVGADERVCSVWEADAVERVVETV